MAARHRISRRTVLRGLLGGSAIAVGLPVLEMFLNGNGNAYANGSPLPKRFGIFFWGNGNLPTKWTPVGAGAGSAWQLSEQLAPLAPVKDKINVLSGFKVYTGNTDPHGSGPVGMLCGQPFLPSDHSTFPAASIDQVIAGAVGGDTRYRSIEVGVQADVTGFSYNGIHSQNPPETSPMALFQRLFGADFTPPGATPKLDPKIPLRISVLDAVAGDAQRLRGQLGKADQARLDQHLDGIRQLELTLQKIEQNPPNLAACHAPGMPDAAYPDQGGRPQLQAVSRAMADIIAMAFACDMTRVLTNWFTQPVNNLLFPGATEGHHTLTHDEPDPQPQVDAIVGFVMTELAYYLQKLDSVAEGDGTLLDHCAILCTTDVSLGRSHSVEEYPIVIAGGCNGAFKTGQHYRSASSENTSKVLLTLAQAMELSVGEYGTDAGHVTDTVGAIVA